MEVDGSGKGDVKEDHVCRKYGQNEWSVVKMEQ